MPENTGPASRPANRPYEQTALRWFYDNDRAPGWTVAEFDAATRAGFCGVSYWSRLSQLRAHEWITVVAARPGPRRQPQVACRITEAGCRELGLPPLPDLPAPQPKVPKMERYTRPQFADELEAADSPLCDCSQWDSPPVSPSTGEPMDHHCDCRAVVASRIVRRGETRTRHDRACGGGED